MYRNQKPSTMFAPTRAGEKATIPSRLTRYLCCLAQTKLTQMMSLGKKSQSY